MSFTETVSPVAAIQAILHDYPFSASILREILQNSDDAGATKQIFVLDKGNSPALIAYNDAQFHDPDWEAIQSIHQSSKKADTTKIGKYGVGFRACYHITDGPQILSGSSFAVLDPLHSGGKKVDYDEFKTTDYRKHFDFFSDYISEPTSFPGTAIRLPLRSSPSELSQRVVRIDELHQMTADYITEEMNVSLLFLDKLKTIEIWESCDATKTRLAMWTKSERTSIRHDQSLHLITYDSTLSDGDANHSWRIVQTQSSEDDAKTRLSQLANSDSVNHIMQKHKLRTDVRIAYPLSFNKRISGRLFTFLPLPSKTGFPAHVHALFALTSSRQGLRNSNETGIVEGSDNDVLIKWNHLLFDHYIPQAWSYLLKSLAEEMACNDIFGAWPPHFSSITSGDGLYWQDILRRTFKVIVDSRLKVWPKVSAQGTTNYVDLQSSLIVEQGQLDGEILAVLAGLGLTLVQLPRDLIQLVDSSMVKLSPSVAHAELKGKLDNLRDLSRDQRAIIRRYLLSDKDIGNIFDLPLLPVLDGSFVSLGHRHTSVSHFIALTSDEAEAFKVSAGDAIRLGDLSAEVASLLREQGPSRANVDLLSPPSVIAYLSSEPQPPSDSRSADFWRWVGEWHLKTELINLLKTNSALRLVPTTKGPQAVSSSIFNVMQDADSARLFGKLGLAFVSGALPLSTVQLLNSYSILKNTDDMNNLLAALSLAPMPSLTDNEAKSTFDHLTTIYYGQLSPENLEILKKLSIFPVMVSDNKSRLQELSNAAVAWRSVHGINIRGISPMKLVPVVDDVHFLDKSCIAEPSSSLLKKLQIPVLGDEDILLYTLDHFASQSRPLRASFVSYIKREQYRLPSAVKEKLQRTQFLRVGGDALQSPGNAIDPNSSLARLFPDGCEDQRLPAIEDNHDKELFNDLRALGLMKTSLTADLIQERISYISSNFTASQAATISHALLGLMNEPNFTCSGLSIDPTMCWLPTREGLVSSKKCINSGRGDSDLFDEVLITLDESISISPSFRALLSWDLPLPLDVLTEQLGRLLGGSEPKAQYRKATRIVRELASRQLSNGDIRDIQEVAAGRPWIPTKSGTLAPHSRAVFATVPDSSGFHEISFSKTEDEIYRFLGKIGCQDGPTVAAISEELTTLKDKCKDSQLVIKRAVQLLEMLPKSIAEKERASLLIPEETGNLVPLNTGIRYYNGNGSPDTEGGKTPIAHHLVTEELAEKLGMDRLGLEAEDDIELGEKPITTIRNALRQYIPEQFFTEFIANASDAKAKRLALLVDDHQGPTNNVFSERMKAFQTASLVVHNDSAFTQEDFRGIRETGIGGKRGKPGKIGYFGLGALSMFHFTELAMIVSGDHVLFLNPAKRGLSYREKNSVLLSLQRVKRLYVDHLEPLNGLFGFDLSSAGPYRGTLFRLPLRTPSHVTDDSVSTKSWDTEEIQALLLQQFDDLAYKSLLFTKLTRIDILARRNSGTEILRSIDSTRVLDNSGTESASKSEILTFMTTNGQRKWIILSTPVDLPGQFSQIAKGYNMRHFLPIQIAAALDDPKVTNVAHNLFCALPLPIATSLPVHISAPLILEQERRNIRLEQFGMESDYNRWLLSSAIPRLYVSLLERLLQNQKSNIAYWPGMRSANVDNVANQIITASFWTELATSSKRVFASKYEPASSLTPSEAVLFPENSSEKTISKILALTKPKNVVELPDVLTEYAAMLRFVDAPFVRTLLEDSQICQQLDKDENYNVISFLCGEEVSLHGLTLLPLEDGTYAPISKQSDAVTMFYKPELSSEEFFPPFKRDRLVHRNFRALQYLETNGYNASTLCETGIIELAQECLDLAPELLGDEARGAWVAAFWDARLKISPDKISHLPLVPTLKPLYFISLEKANNPSVVLVLKGTSSQDFNYNILQRLGMTIVVQQNLPEALRQAVAQKKHSVYSSFLSYMQEGPQRLASWHQLECNDQKELSRWVRSKFAHTPKELVDIGCKIPVWPAQQRTGDGQLAALNDVTILPSSVPAGVLRQFTENPVVDWKDSMKNIKEPLTAKRITGLLRVSAGYLLRTTERSAYRKLVEHLLNLEVDCLLVPDEEFVLKRADELFERHELFTAAFKSQPQRLLSEDFQGMAERLESYGLKRRRRLDLSMFIECAQAFDQDRERNKRTRSVRLYRAFDALSLSYWRDHRQCSQLDNLRFIPRIDSQRPGYGSIDIVDYVVDDLLKEVLSPSQITLPEFAPICWSQKGQTDPPPNATLRGTYETLGKPRGTEVLAHLKVLAEIGQEHGRHSGLLSDLKATYKWLNDNLNDDEFKDLIVHQYQKRIFLNVNDPDSDEWVWHSASALVMDLPDVEDVHDVKNFLRGHNDLLKAAGVRKVEKVAAREVSPTDKTTHIREQFSKMREIGWGTDVVFQTTDDACQIPPAHRSWLSANSKHFWTSFIDSGWNHNEHEIISPPERFSSLCVKEVINWIYVGRLSELLSTTAGDSGEEKKEKLELGLDVLALSHYWQVMDLHEHLQVFIINAPGFINPFWVNRIRQHAETTMATKLVEACREYERVNLTIIEDFVDSPDSPQDDAH